LREKVSGNHGQGRPLIFFNNSSKENPLLNALFFLSEIEKLIFYHLQFMKNFFVDDSTVFGGIKFFWSNAEKDLSREKQSPKKKFSIGGDLIRNRKKEPAIKLKKNNNLKEISMKLLKYALSILFCNAYRFLRFIPNNDPIMGCMLPFSKQDKWWQGALFAFITMASFDFLVGKTGIWTIVTASTYAFLGLMFHVAFKNKKKIKLKHYLGSGVLGVLIFDLVTGPIMSSWLFKIPFEAAVVGQVPFTAMHLISVSFFIVLLTPLFDRAIASNPSLEDTAVFNRLRFWTRA